MVAAVTFTKQLAAANATLIAASQSPGTSALTLTSSIVIIDISTSSNTSLGRRVIITSGGNDSGITFTITGTNSTGNIISDVIAGTNASTAQSNKDFVTVTSITPSAAVATTVTAGTNGVGSSAWSFWNWLGNPPLNIGIAVELVSGAVNFTVQHTYDDPNNLGDAILFPLPFNFPAITGATATVDGAYTTPITATRVLINSGTGVIRVRFLQAGIG